MVDFAYTLAPALLLVVLFVAILVAAEIGFYLGRWIARRHDEHESPLFSVVEGGVLGLVGLILAFSFSIAVGRFDNRQHLVVIEANDIETTSLRSIFLPPALQPGFRSDLKDYANTRIALYVSFRHKETREVLRTKSSQLQSQLWARAGSAQNASPNSKAMSLLVESLNHVIDDSGEQQAALTNRVPAEVVVLLLFVAAVAAALLGYGFGIMKTERRIMTVIFCLLITMLVYTIFDLDRPQTGYIRVNLDPLRAVARSMR